MKNQINALKERISLLESRQTQEIVFLREQFHFTYETLKPLNLIKTTFQEVSSSPDLKDNILNNVIGLTTGYLSKKVLVGSTHNPIKQIAGTLLQFAIANVVSKHSETIKAIGEVLLRHIFENRGKAKQENFKMEISNSMEKQVKELDF
jgi:hypothetical protein